MFDLYALPTNFPKLNDDSRRIKAYRWVKATKA